MPRDRKKAIIIGAGPAGLTAAYELVTRTNIKPVIVERSEYMGGIARTLNFKGNRIDLGGHRFFSKSDIIMDWWLNILPLQELAKGRKNITYQSKSRFIDPRPNGPDPNKSDLVMLLRKRKSRVYFLRKFFDYPISLNRDTITKLGISRSIRIGLSYFKSTIAPIKPEKSLEDFFINRFGKELYLTFFKSYTEKVWGLSCSKISAEWGMQRIKGLSVKKAIFHYIKKTIRPDDEVAQRGTETTLIEQFLYPKYGPGQMWEEVAKKVKQRGGKIITNSEVTKIFSDGTKIKSVEVVDTKTGKTSLLQGEYFFSTMAITDLFRALIAKIPRNIYRISQGLAYREFITVGLLMKELKIKEKNLDDHGLISDNWIYIQEPDVLLGRVQIFNNWSPYMVKDKNTTWLGLEYFCSEKDKLWKMRDKEIIELAIKEIDKIRIIDKENVLDAVVFRMPKTYPAYFGTYNRFKELQKFIDRFDNLFLVGRNGMHKYNNQDHSMLTAMAAVDNIINGRLDKSNIWAVNTEQDYHESK